MVLLNSNDLSLCLNREYLQKKKRTEDYIHFFFVDQIFIKVRLELISGQLFQNCDITSNIY
jgi:hypothetical protein